MRRILVTIYFDIEEDIPEHKRDYDRFIIETEAINYNRRLFQVFEERRYSWDDYKRFKRGYKPIMKIKQLDLTELEVIRDNELVKVNSLAEDLLEELELEA